MNKRFANKIMFAVIITAAVFSAAALAQTAPQAGLNITRPFMRQIYVSYTAPDSYITCDVSQREFWFEPYAYLETLNISQGQTAEMNMQNTASIQRDVLFSCQFAEVNATVNSMYVLAGSSIVTTNTVTQTVTSTTTQTQTLTCAPVTTTSTVTHTTTVTYTTTVTAPSCASNGDHCSHDSDCCSDNCHFGSCQKGY